MDLVCALQAHLKTPDAVNALETMPSAQREAATRIGQSVKKYVDLVEGRRPHLVSDHAATSIGFVTCNRKEERIRRLDTGEVIVFKSSLDQMRSNIQINGSVELELESGETLTVKSDNGELVAVPR